jgi:hypothetical protein
MANTEPRLATLGQEMLTSSPTIADGRAGRQQPGCHLGEFGGVPPAIETRTRAPTDASHGRSWSAKASIPGPCRPIELSIPRGSRPSAGCRGRCGGRHDRLGDERSESGDVEEAVQLRPFAAQPEAVMIGLGRRRRPVDARRGQFVCRARSSVPSDPPARCPDGVVGHGTGRRRRRPSAPVTVEDRPVEAGAHHPGAPSGPMTGSTQVMQTPTPQAMASSTATWATAPARCAMLPDRRSIPIGPQA